MTFELDESLTEGAIMKVVGIGGAGGNAINGMIQERLVGVDFVAVNTDLQALESNRSEHKIQIGRNLTKGLGAGADPEIGRKAIEEDRERVAEMLQDTDMVFITAGMGGGTGTGASPAIADLAREFGALTVGIVTKPFLFEGRIRMKHAEDGIAELKDRVDTLIVIPNQRLLSIVTKDTPLREAFYMADRILYHATRGISDLITIPGLVNLDFADVRRVMRERGNALMGTGVASGSNKAVEAATQAISSPLLEDVSIKGAEGVLMNICGGKEMSLYEINDATSVVFEATGSDAEIIFGAVIDENMRDEMRVTVIATGFDKKCQPRIDRDAIMKDIINRDSDTDREVPTHKRIERKERDTAFFNLNAERNKSFAPEDLDIPAFLRKQMD